MMKVMIKKEEKVVILLHNQHAAWSVSSGLR